APSAGRRSAVPATRLGHAAGAGPGGRGPRGRRHHHLARGRRRVRRHLFVRARLVSGCAGRAGSIAGNERAPVPSFSEAGFFCSRRAAGRQRLWQARHLDGEAGGGNAVPRGRGAGEVSVSVRDTLLQEGGGAFVPCARSCLSIWTESFAFSSLAT